jgi:toxin-antitoxin system PIN domain toxin
MPTVALLDVNVLVALFDPDHVHHDLAHGWFAENGSAGFATCPLTENGFVRVVTHPAYHPDPPRPAVVFDRLRKFCEGGRHHFWPDSVSLRDESVFIVENLAGHRQLTDIYLLGLARKMGGRLATFDRAISMSAVKGARATHLAIIEP